MPGGHWKVGKMFWRGTADPHGRDERTDQSSTSIGLTRCSGLALRESDCSRRASTICGIDAMFLIDPPPPSQNQCYRAVRTVRARHRLRLMRSGGHAPPRLELVARFQGSRGDMPWSGNSKAKDRPAPHCRFVEGLAVGLVENSRATCFGKGALANSPPAAGLPGCPIW